MGWLGWSPGVARRANVNDVVLALDAKSDLLSTIYGDGKPRPKGGKGKVTGHDFKAFAARHNAGTGGKRGG
jgi:hypothetical protein